MRRTHGFTLIEVLVVVAIIALLLGILLPVLSKARRSGKEATCAADLRSLQQVTRLYADDNKRYYPDFKVDYGKNPVYTSTKRTPHFMRQYYRRMFEEKYGVSRQHFYSPLNESWNADDHWQWDNDQWYTLMGRFYFSSRTIQPHLYANTVDPPDGLYAVMFPATTTEPAYFNLMWTDLNLQTKIATTNDWVDPATGRVASNHLYDNAADGWPDGSHQSYEDGSVVWKEGKEITWRVQVDNVEIWWAE